MCRVAGERREGLGRGDPRIVCWKCVCDLLCNAVSGESLPTAEIKRKKNNNNKPMNLDLLQDVIRFCYYLPNE